MSSPDRSRSPRHPGRRTVLSLMLLGGAAVVAGCQVRPLYADRADGVSTNDDMRAIAVKYDRPSDDDITRILQKLRNELAFDFSGGGEALPPRFELRLFLSERESEVGIEEDQDVPAARLVSITATFTLTDLESRTVVISGTSFATASYDFSSQRFANIRALRDAEDRAAVSLAANIRTRVAAALATRGT
ncbi:hypothetical protein [Methylobrevis pamukkalensis]|uniref:LPS-assembly lipoprotein n=1 Tax=Methylobrevis pamukkalensis TaxID=1439726 RepID=A0A1E3H710_9HYPH|nr:hypothetical protein [Methylobrevis pamukkalensis]ODN72117.1 hypothetical protein A6302_00521 [Methylobrevis pamukkalensis]